MAEVKRIQILGEVQSGPIAASTSIEAGNILAVNASGYIVHAADTAGLKTIGVALESVDNSAGSNGDKSVEFAEGIFEVTASSITQAMWKGDLYIVDSTTVDNTSTNKVWAGKLYKFISSTLCWVDLRMHLQPSPAAAGISLEHLDSGIAPSHIVVAADNSVATAGGDATETVTISGVTATDVAIVTLKVKGSTPRTILTAACTTNTLTVVFSDDPSNDHEFAYVILRAAA